MAYILTGKDAGLEGEYNLCVQFNDWRDAYAFSKASTDIVATDTSSIPRTQVSMQFQCVGTFQPQPNE